MKSNLNNVSALFEDISSRWFLSEPLLFSVYCTHHLVPNSKLNVPFRTGKMRIEYSENLISELDEKTVEELLKIEIIRILLKHPYQREPPFAKRKVLTQASNITINDVYEISCTAKKFLKGLDYNLPKNLSFEEYYSLVYEILSHGKPNTNCNSSIIPSNLPGKNDDDDEDDEKSDEKDFDETQNQNSEQNCHAELDSASLNKKIPRQVRNANENPQIQNDEIFDSDEQISALWEEDESTCFEINNLIENAENSENWGTLPGSLQNLIKASRKIEMDYRKMLSIFRTSVISSKRRLTRMRPSRRFGFANLGSRYELATKLLIAVDVSGSVSDKSLSNFFSVINRFFKYGIETLDVIQFDSELKSENPFPMKKASQTVKIIGRGGTNFQAAANFYLSHSEYDGLIYFTDGFAPLPEFKTKRRIDVLWVLQSKREYENFKNQIKSLRRNRATYIPNPELKNEKQKRN